MLHKKYLQLLVCSGARVVRNVGDPRFSRNITLCPFRYVERHNKINIYILRINNAHKALAKVEINSKLTLECIEALDRLGRQKSSQQTDLVLGSRI